MPSVPWSSAKSRFLSNMRPQRSTLGISTSGNEDGVGMVALFVNGGLARAYGGHLIIVAVGCSECCGSDALDLMKLDPATTKYLFQERKIRSTEGLVLGCYSLVNVIMLMQTRRQGMERKLG